MSKAKEKEFVNYVVTGSRYQVQNAQGEMLPEFGIGVFRSGVRLELAMRIYIASTGGEGAALGSDKAAARSHAANAFALSEVFLEEMDRYLKIIDPPRKPPPPENNGK